MSEARPITGLAAIGLAVAFNVPYAILASTFAYPGILRSGAGEALARYDAGGPELVLVWYLFMLAALALVPLACALALTPERIAKSPALAIGAAITGALAGILQAVGLARWVFVVPGLAAAAGGEGAQHTFDVLNQYGGVAIGEHLGQLMTALFVLQLAQLQRNENRAITAALGFATAIAIALGTGEGLAIALGRDGHLFSAATIVGFLGLTVWLIATGLGLMTGARRRVVA